MVAAGAIRLVRRRWQIAGANQIIGSWELTVDRGLSAPPVRGADHLHAAIRWSDRPTCSRRRARDVKHLSGRLYADTHVFFRFDSAPGRFWGRRSQRDRGLAPDGDRTRRLRSRICSIRRQPRRRRLRATVTAKRIHRPDPGSAVDHFLGLGASTRPGRPASREGSRQGVVDRLSLGRTRRAAGARLGRTSSSRRRAVEMVVAHQTRAGARRVRVVHDAVR